jgi:hypothetical protein
LQSRTIFLQNKTGVKKNPQYRKGIEPGKDNGCCCRDKESGTFADNSKEIQIEPLA